jgi:flagellar biosynthesis anti-sigma factor FlgM
MKIEEKSAINGTQATVESSRPVRATSTPAPEVQDKVSVGQASQLSQSVKDALKGSGAERAARLQSLEAAIRHGHYQPNPQQIANQILEQGELDARLRALLDK